MVVAEANKAMVLLGWRLQGLDLAGKGEEGPASLKLCDFCCCSRPVSGDLDGLEARPLQGFSCAARAEDMAEDSGPD